MNSCIYIHSKVPENYFNRYKLTSRAKQKIVKGSEIRASTWSGFNRFFRKIEFEESYIIPNLQQ